MPNTHNNPSSRRVPVEPVERPAYEQGFPGDPSFAYQEHRSWRLEVTSDFTHSVYLASRTDGREGSGLGPDRPRDVSTPAKLQAVYDEYANIPTKFIYAPGTYETEGWRRNVRDTIFSNHHHQGAGQGVTTLRLVNAANPFNDGRIFGQGNNADDKIDNFSVNGMTLDCNAQAQPFWGAGNNGPALAVFIYSGTNIRVEDCRIIGFGTQGGEAFPVGLLYDSSFPDPNIQVRDCTFTEPATGNAAGTSVNLLTSCLIIPVAGNTADAGNSGIYNCRFINLTSDFAQSFGCQASIVEGCYFDGMSRGIYHEIQPISFTSRSIRFTNNIIKNFRDRGINVFQIAESPIRDTQVAIHNNLVIPTFANNGSLGISVATQTQDGIQSVFATNNEVRFEDGLGQIATTASPRGFSFSGIENLVTMNNLSTLYDNPGQLGKEMEKVNITNDTTVNNFRSNGVALP